MARIERYQQWEDRVIGAWFVYFGALAYFWLEWIGWQPWYVALPALVVQHYVFKWLLLPYLRSTMAEEHEKPLPPLPRPKSWD